MGPRKHHSQYISANPQNDATYSEYSCRLNPRRKIQTFEATNKSRLSGREQQRQHRAPDFASFSPGFELALEQRTSGEGTATKTQNTSLPHTAVTTATFVTHKQCFIENGSSIKFSCSISSLAVMAREWLRLKLPVGYRAAPPGAATSETTIFSLPS